MTRHNDLLREALRREARERWPGWREIVLPVAVSLLGWAALSMYAVR